ncbi:hypothetical protein [Lentzea guizhouensis]|nr:hypothetical protein [Lentzea guizhouensis]
MGLFGKRATKTPKTATVGRFHTPYQVEQVLGVVYAGVRDQLSTAVAEVGEPGVMASIYLSRIDRTGLTVTAGNIADTYFTFAVDLSESGSGTDGHVYFDRPSSAVQRWYGNAVQLNVDLHTALDRASITVQGWRIQF